jgi:carboxylate-amine ligase
MEEEVFLVDPRARAVDLLDELGEDPRFKPELPAAQLEILTPPCETVDEAIAILAGGRRDLAARAAVIGAGVHPTAPTEGELNEGDRYDHTHERYQVIARRQLVGALQVHVAVAGRDRALAVFNSLRSYLPEIAALAANAPFQAGRDTGLASVRPTIGTMLPRQGVPPPIASWEEFAADLAWGVETRALPDARSWWWELRPHATYGTLEVRVPDTQITCADSAAVAALVHSLVAWLAAHHDGGERLPVHPAWRIAENRWSACRYGMDGRMADLETGRTVPTRERLEGLIEAVAPVAAGLGCASALDRARRLALDPGAARQRRIVGERGLDGLVDWLAGEFAAQPGS